MGNIMERGNPTWKSVFKTFWFDVRELLACKKFSLIILLVGILTYFFFLTTVSVGVDELTSDRYLGGELLAQGRFTGQIINSIMSFDRTEVLQNLVGVVAYAAGSILMLVYLQSFLSGRRFKLHAAIMFCSIFISYPLLVESFNYHGLPFAIGGNMILIAIILWIIRLNPKGWLPIAILLLCLSASWHEGEIPVYLCAIFSGYLLDALSHEKRETEEKILQNIAKYIIPLGLALVVKTWITRIIQTVVHIDASTVAGNTISWLSKSPIECIKTILYEMKYEYFLKAFYYFPISILLISTIIFFIFIIKYTIQKKNLRVFVLGACVLGSLFSLTIVSGKLMPYRASQVFSLFIAFSWCLFNSENSRIIKRRLIMTASLLIVVNQIISSNYWFEVDHLRAQEEGSFIQSLGYDLSTINDEDKPVVFVGSYSESTALKNRMYISSDSFWAKSINAMVGINGYKQNERYWVCIPQTIGNSAITWGIEAFAEVNTELLRLFSYYGYDIKQGTKEMYDSAKCYFESNDDGGKTKIVEFSNYIAVKIG